jgi:salicylate hydroxylase
MHVIIAGAGIGGLTAALCCAHRGLQVTVLEQAETISEVGAGIQIPPNAMKVFEALGIAGLIARNAFAPEAIECRMGESGMTLFNVPLGDKAQARWGSPYLHIHRADYIAALREALETAAPNRVRIGAKLVSYTQNDAAVTAHLEDGTHISGDVLIGADGIHSSVREQMLGPDKPVFTGNVAWRAVVPVEALGDNVPNPTACAWMGRGKHAVTYRLRRGALANFVGVVERDDWKDEAWTATGTREDALTDFAGWHPSVTSILNAVQEGHLFRWALFDRLPLKTWTGGRAALLGDAAHPMLPFMAQGAAMAVEDGYVLARELAEGQGDVSAALQSYQHKRYDRATELQAASRANAKTFHKRTWLGRVSTYGPMWMAGRAAPWAVRGRLDPTYGHDVTADAR